MEGEKVRLASRNFRARENAVDQQVWRGRPRPRMAAAKHAGGLARRERTPPGRARLSRAITRCNYDALKPPVHRKGRRSNGMVLSAFNSSRSSHPSSRPSCQLHLRARPELRDTRSYHTASRSLPSCRHRSRSNRRSASLTW